MPEKRHPGITMHRLSFGGGFMGLLFAAGSATIFLIGFPALWYFVALAAALGLGIAVFLRISRQSRDARNRPMSILAVADPRKSRRSRERVKWHRSFRSRPALTSA